MINAPVLHVNGDHPEGEKQPLKLKASFLYHHSRHAGPTLTASYLYLRCRPSDRGRVRVQKLFQEGRYRGSDRLSPVVSVF